MDPEELAELNRRLRQFAVANGMSWVVDELEDAIAVGVFEARELRQSTRGGQTTYEDVPEMSRGRKRAEEFVGRRSLTPEEEIRLMLAGLRRVLVDLDQVATTSVLQLNELASVTQSPADVDLTDSADFTSRRHPVVTEIDYVPDVGSSAGEVSTEGLRHTRRSNAAAEILRRIEAEIR